MNETTISKLIKLKGTLMRQSIRTAKKLATLLCAITLLASCVRLNAPSCAESVNVPVTHQDFRNDPASFQFAIVADRTGGMRPGVFGRVIPQLNLLQPEFVMSIGDLIDGGTEDVALITSQWVEFDWMVDRLQMPFYYVGGNHDLSNPVMEDVWRERLGDPYYHFVYQDVLFLVLDTEDRMEDGNGVGFSARQREYAARVLAENEDVRWTFMFFHRPAWLENKGAGSPGWGEMKALFSDRPHTIFTGHYHGYGKDVVDGNDYYHLATTGGASQLKGVEVGSMDHIVWVTMNEDGPLIANILLDSVYDDELSQAKPEQEK